MLEWANNFLMEYREKFYYLGLLLTIIGLSFSNVMLSNGFIILGATWLFDKELKRKIKVFLANKIAVSISLIYLVHLIGLLYTSDFQFAANDIKTKLPLFAFPLIMSSAPALSKSKIRFFLLIFSFSVLASYITAIYIYFTQNLVDARYAFIFVSHIRLSLEAVIAIFILIYYAFNKQLRVSVLAKLSLLFSAFLLLWFMMLLGQMSGIFIGLFTSLLIFGFFIFIKLERKMKVASLIGLVVILTTIFFIISNEVKNYLTPFDEPILTKTIKGNPYEDKRNSYPVENGRYIGANICWIEMEEAWNERSTLGFNEMTGNSNTLPETLLRYLNSKGLSKDYAGVMLLSDKDVQNVEAGFANVEYTLKTSLKKRLFKVLWEYSIFETSGMIGGNSTVQRLVLWQNGFEIFTRNPIFGVGTGDVGFAFEATLEANKSPLKNSGLRSHNNYLAFLIAFGLLGFTVIMTLLIYPVVKFKLYKNYLFMVFFLAYMVSMLWEDTMETQVGVTIFAFFFSFLAIQKLELQPIKFYFDEQESDEP